MSSDPFDLLGLDRKTASDADVRRAYAERLKATRPEDDRAGFMALRAAFERARESVRWREQYGDDDPYEDYEEDDEGAEVSAAQTSAADDELTFAGVDESRLEVREIEAEPERDLVEESVTALIGALTDNPFGASVGRVMQIIEADAVSGIDDFQEMQWRVRNFLCDRTGYNLEPPEIRQPEWLTPHVYDALDTYYGWTRQPATETWVRRQNDWLARVRRDIGLAALPKEERKKAELSRALEELGHASEEKRANTDGGGLNWLAIGAGILGYALFQFFTRGPAG